MEAVLGLLVMSLLASQGETLCDGRKDGAVCYGALGGSVVLQLMDDASEIPRYEWKNETTVILNGKKSAVIKNNIGERSVFTPSAGTLIINNLNRKDSGIYNLSLFDENGKSSEERTLNLSIQANVTSVQLTYECLFEGEKRISCSAGGGDSPQFNWTLDGRRLTEEELVSGPDETNSVTLKRHVSGQLVCLVHNHISNTSGTTELNTCGYLPILAGVLATLVILTVVALVIIYFMKKKQHNKTKEEDDDHELMYADVRILQQQRRPVGHRPEPEVEYGQVKFSERPRQPGARTDDCVYSEVRNVR